MKSILSIIIASSYGLTMRLMYGFFEDSMEVMSSTFLILLPVIIGFLTVLFLSKDMVKSSVGAFFLPLANKFSATNYHHYIKYRRRDLLDNYFSCFCSNVWYRRSNCF